MSKRQKAPAKAAPLLPTEEEAANIQQALDQYADRPKRVRPPHTKARYLGPNRVEVGPPHDDRAGWAKALGASLGVDSPGAASILMASASAIMGELGINSQEDADAHMAREMKALEFVSAIRPKTTLEATLAVQMLGAHEASMLMMRGVHKAKTVQQQADYVRLMNQSMRTFTAQVDALTKLRTGGKQQMEVRYVYVDARSQTVIGGYPAGEGEGPRAAIGNQQQAHAPGFGALGYAPPGGLPVWSEDKGRDAVSGPRHPGETSLPDARRTKHRRPKGRGERQLSDGSLDAGNDTGAGHGSGLRPHGEEAA